MLISNKNNKWPPKKDKHFQEIFIIRLCFEELNAILKIQCSFSLPEIPDGPGGQVGHGSAGKPLAPSAPAAP